MRRQKFAKLYMVLVFTVAQKLLGQGTFQNLGFEAVRNWAFWLLRRPEVFFCADSRASGRFALYHWFWISVFEIKAMRAWPDKCAAANPRPAGQSEGSDELPAINAADRAFPVAVAELGRYAQAD